MSELINLTNVFNFLPLVIEYLVSTQVILGFGLNRDIEGMI